MMKHIVLVALVLVAVASARPQFAQPQQFAPPPPPTQQFGPQPVQATSYVARTLLSDDVVTPDGIRVIRYITDNGILYTERYLPVDTPQGRVYNREVTVQYYDPITKQYSNRALIAGLSGVVVTGNDLPVQAPAIHQ